MTKKSGRNLCHISVTAFFSSCTQFTWLMFSSSVLIMISALGSRSNHNKNKWFLQNMHTFVIFMRETSIVILTFMDYIYSIILYLWATTTTNTNNNKKVTQEWKIEKVTSCYLARCMKLICFWNSFLKIGKYYIFR